MRRAYGLEEIPSDIHWPVATLGTFDGVHLGHQKILSDTMAWAREKAGTAVAVTFRQLPRALASRKPARCITSCEHRLTLFERLGIDLTVVLDFTPELMSMPAEEFAEAVFCRGLHARGVQWGFNCRFGKGAEGDIELMKRLRSQCGFEVRMTDAVTLDGKPISSTAIRAAVIEGDLDRAAGMLGRRVSLLGTTVHGAGRGHDLGFPTANLDLLHETVPPPGIYACMAIVHGREYVAVTNIGACPTFDPPKPPDTVEVHILDFDLAIRGEQVEVRFLRLLRDELKFDTPEALVRQIELDIIATRRIAAEIG